MRIVETLRAQRSFPWRAPRHEVLLLVLVALATFSVVQPFGAQDTSRLCLTRAILHGRLAGGSCLLGGVDRAAYGGHLYSDKAPGLSVLAVPAAVLVQLPRPSEWVHSGDLRLWAVRLLSVGLAFITCVFLLGRVAEGLAPGWGGASLVALALGTLMSSLAGATYEEVPAAFVSFAAFLLAWRGSPFLAGLVAGLSLLVAYQSGLIAAIVGLYLVLAGARAALRYLAGLVPGVVLLGAYNWAAFGSPFHLSYRYVNKQFAQQQAQGFFGIHEPSWAGVRSVLVGDRGLLIDAPVLALAAYGLVLLARRGYPAEAVTCGLVTLCYLLIEFGYWDPYGGFSPGPRFFVPALPFLMLGVAPVFATRRTLTTALVLLSVIASTAVFLTWTFAAETSAVGGYAGTVWNQILLLLEHGRSAKIVGWAPRNILHWVGLQDSYSRVLVALLSFTALAIALRDGWRSKAVRARS